MITPFTVYLITRLDSLTIFLNIIGAILFLWAFIYVTINLDELGATEKQPKKFVRNIGLFVITIILTLFLNLAIPSTRDAMLMYGIPAAINAAENTQLPNNLFKFINTWLIKETEKETLKPTISQ